MNSLASLLILNGGLSSRMNFNAKDLLKNKQNTFIESIIENCRLTFNEILIIGKQRSISNTQFVADEIPNSGPVGGIYSGLKASQNEINIVIACDMPLLNTTVFMALLELSKKFPSKNIIPQKANFLLPLSAIYLKSNLCFFETALQENNFRLLNVIDKMDNIIVPANQLSTNESAFLNINTEDDYLRFQKIVNG